MEKSIEKTKKIIEAQNDINELTEVIHSPDNLRRNGVDVFNRIFNKLVTSHIYLYLPINMV